LLQPLDVVVFQPLKHYHAEAVEAAIRMGCGDFDKVEFLDKIDSIRQQTFQPSTIASAKCKNQSWSTKGGYGPPGLPGPP